MKFIELKLYTQCLKQELAFYSEVLGFKLTAANHNSFTVKIGWSKLTFEQKETVAPYHFCFLIPSNKLKEAKAWIAQKTPVFIDENNQVVQHFESWNADAFYFNDAGGNIVEFIVRYDLANETQDEFDNTQVLGVNEMGMPHQNVKQILEKLQHEIETERWKGDLERFGTSGTQEGIFLIPNYKLKDFWFPTKIKIEPVNFEAVIENKQQRYLIEYKNEVVSTQKL